MIPADRCRNGSFVTVGIIERTTALTLGELLQLSSRDRVTVLPGADHAVPDIVASVSLKAQVRFAASFKVIIRSKSRVATIVLLVNLTNYRLGCIDRFRSTIARVARLALMAG